MSPFSPTAADVLEFYNSGEVGHGHLPAATGDRLPVRPANPGKWDLPVPDSIRKTHFGKTVTLFGKTLTLFTKTVTRFAKSVTLFAKTVTLFAKTETHSAGPVTQSALYYDCFRSLIHS